MNNSRRNNFSYYFCKIKYEWRLKRYIAISLISEESRTPRSLLDLRLISLIKDYLCNILLAIIIICSKISVYHIFRFSTAQVLEVFLKENFI